MPQVIISVPANCCMWVTVGSGHSWVGLQLGRVTVGSGHSWVGAQLGGLQLGGLQLGGSQLGGVREICLAQAISQSYEIYKLSNFSGTISKFFTENFKLERFLIKSWTKIVRFVYLKAFSFLANQQ